MPNLNRIGDSGVAMMDEPGVARIGLQMQSAEAYVVLPGPRISRRKVPMFFYHNKLNRTIRR